MVVTEQIINDDGRGPSYQWQPFTPNWGFECEVWYPVEGIDRQLFVVGFTDSWSTIAAPFQNVVGVALHHIFGGEDKVEYWEMPSMWVSPIANQSWTSPVGAFFGQSLTIRVWCENDEWIRIWLNNQYVGSMRISDSYKLGPGRRCMRFMNRSYCHCYVRWVDHYDRTPSIPPVTVWSSVQYDDFNRADGPVGGVWTQFGTNAGIVNNSWSNTGTTDGGRGLLWDTGNGSGKIRIEATAGGNTNPNNTAASSLILCSNVDGSQALAANIFQGALYVSNLSGSLVSPTMADLNSLPSGVTVAPGDRVAFSVHNGTCWIEINGIPKLYVGQAHGTVPATNTYAGLRVERRSGTNSHSWNDVRVFSGV
jgi:hypothetical protein